MTQVKVTWGLYSEYEKRKRHHTHEVDADSEEGKLFLRNLWNGIHGAVSAGFMHFEIEAA